MPLYNLTLPSQLTFYAFQGNLKLKFEHRKCTTCDMMFLFQAMEMSDFLVKNKLEQIVENFKVRFFVIFEIFYWMTPTIPYLK